MSVLMPSTSSVGSDSVEKRAGGLEELSEELTSGKNLEELVRAVGASCYQQGLAHGFLRAARRLKKAAVKAFLGDEEGAPVLRKAFLDVFGRGREKRDEHRRRWKGRREEALEEIARRQRLIEDLLHVVAEESDQLDKKTVASWQEDRTLFQGGPAYEVGDLGMKECDARSDVHHSDEESRLEEGGQSNRSRPDGRPCGQAGPADASEEKGRLDVERSPGGDGRSGQGLPVPPMELSAPPGVPSDPDDLSSTEDASGAEGPLEPAEADGSVQANNPAEADNPDDPMDDVAAAVRVLKDVCGSEEPPEDTRSAGSQNRPASD